MEIEFKKIELEDQELISHFFAHHTSRSCERTFTNVYLWARFYDVSFAVVEESLVFKSENEEGCAFAYPAGEPEQVRRAIDALMEYSKGRGEPFRMYNVTPDNTLILNSGIRTGSGLNTMRILRIMSMSPRSWPRFPARSFTANGTILISLRRFTRAGGVTSLSRKRIWRNASRWL